MVKGGNLSAGTRHSANSHSGLGRRVAPGPRDLDAKRSLTGARSGRHYDELDEALGGLHQVDIEPIDWQRAREVHRDLAYQTGGGQRAVNIPDLIVASAAERTDLPVAHYDEDYDRIAAITGQASVGVARRGSL